jgi:hypothetical protein
VNVLFTHQKWAEFVGKSGQACLSEVPWHVRWVVTGDYHERRWGELDDGRQVWSPGSTHATSIADSSPRCFLAGHDRAGVLECEFVPLKSRPIFRLRADTDAALADVVGPSFDTCLDVIASSDLPAPVRRPIVEVQYADDIPDAYLRLQAIADRCYLFPRPRDRARRERPDAATRPRVEIEDAVAHLSQPGTPGHDWTLRLLAADDRRAEWLAISDEVRQAVV